MSKSLAQNPTLTTELVTYSYNLNDGIQLDAYHALIAQLSETRECFSSIATSGRAKLKTGTIQLDTAYVFDNQWNTRDDSETNPKMRVFDWHESIQPNSSIKQGHYLTLTSEMVTLRASVAKCGYCGSMHRLSDALGFCDQCIDSEYLEEKQLHLLRLRPICESKADMPPLSDDELSLLKPLYVEAQTTAIGSRAVKARAAQLEAIEIELNKSIAEAETKYHGFRWLLDKHVNIRNCIYYSHQDSFCFGWKETVSESVRDALLYVLDDFPFPYTIKCNDGKTVRSK